MTQEFVPYELAAKLKAIGFNEPCMFVHDTWGNTKNWTEDGEGEHRNSHINASIYYSAPTFSQAFRWFREKYGLQSFPDYTYYDGFHYGFKWVRSNGEYGEEWKDNNENPKGWDTPEEAELACLDKLIEIVETKSE